MASCKVEEKHRDTKDLASTCRPEDIIEELQSDVLNATVKSQKSGRFRRTALTFFGVRKSICILPNFFGGRGKNQTKGSTKKGITKSKTHDGLSKVSQDDSLGGKLSLAGDCEYHSQRDSSGELYTCSHSECSQLSAEQKSLTLGRQKKGLRSLFHSFRHQRNHRNSGMHKREMIAMSSPHCKKDVPVVQDNTNEYVTECLGFEPDVPLADVIYNVPISPECDADAVALEKSVEQESSKSESDDHIEGINLLAVVSKDCEKASREHGEPCLKVQMVSEPLLNSETPSVSSDQLNLIFGDVASLKSFDSLTGCGDIIADQEDDSITESTVSGERSRNGGKRASCYLTYQGGGEEMASPEDVGNECHDVWGNNTVDEICCSCSQDHTDMTAELTSSHNIDLMNSNSAHQASGMDTSSITDALTPQSEHQESVPNSDEGYYDSTTPGPDEVQEKTDRLRTDRLPRDSYSGDALYELFATDESLISPQYENTPKLPGSKQCECLTESANVTDSAFVSEMDQLQISAELYEVHDLLDSSNSELAQNLGCQQEISLTPESDFNSKPHFSSTKNNVASRKFDEKGNVLSSTEKRTKLFTADTEKSHSSITFGNASDPDFETFCEPKEQDLVENKPVALPYRNISPQSPDCNDLDDGQTVCFSQALEDYTKHSQMLSNLHNSVDDLETNSAFTPNMEALPTIVTFDVVDMHNEGEYDEHIHMELEEDISSPYQEFEESYLQKDAFAEFDCQMLGLYEQNLAGNTWAVASLPRHLGLTRVSQSMPNPLSLDRRSRSLDTESLELTMSDTYREERATTVSCPQTENELERDPSPPYKKNVSAADAKDCSSIMSLTWEPRSDMSSSLPLTKGEVAEKLQCVSQAHVKHKIYYNPSSCDFSHCKLQPVSDRVSCDLVLQSAELYARQGQLHLQSGSCLPHSTFVYPGMVEEGSTEVDDIFCKVATNFQSYSPHCKSRQLANLEGVCHSQSPLNASVSKDEMAVPVEKRAATDVVCPLACNAIPETTFN